MRKGRIPGWLLVVLVVPALWVFVRLTATPLHPNPAEAPTVARAAPAAGLAGAVETARQIALAHLVGANLPGLP